MNPTLPVYDFNDPVFKMNLKLKRWAREHIELAGMHSDVISWEVAETVSPLRIPVVYHIHYRIRSIVGIDEAQNPVYGNHHVLSLALPPQYPLEGCKIYMLTDIWHPNVKWEGKYKGRVCGNTESFGLSYSLYQLVLRVGEILQYKNYHAIPDEEPYPEDLTVAKWVLEFAEPHGIVNKYQEIAVDDSPLVRVERDSDETTVPATAAPPPPQQPVPVEPPVVPAPPPTPESGGIRIKIGALRTNPEHKPKITITPRD